MGHELMGPNLTQAEGMVLGTAAKMFTIVGPVILYGVSASVVYGLRYWLSLFSKEIGCAESGRSFFYGSYRNKKHDRKNE